MARENSLPPLKIGLGADPFSLVSNGPRPGTERDTLDVGFGDCLRLYGIAGHGDGMAVRGVARNYFELPHYTRLRTDGSTRALRLSRLIDAVERRHAGPRRIAVRRGPKVIPAASRLLLRALPSIHGFLMRHNKTTAADGGFRRRSGPALPRLFDSATHRHCAQALNTEKNTRRPAAGSPGVASIP